MSGPDIPDEVVEVAASVDYPTQEHWDAEEEHVKEHFRAFARRALAAAQPLLVEAARATEPHDQRSLARAGFLQVERERDEARAQVASVLALLERYEAWDGDPDYQWKSSPKMRDDLRAAARVLRDRAEAGGDHADH